jgi:hypothetical protein
MRVGERCEWIEMSHPAQPGTSGDLRRLSPRERLSSSVPPCAVQEVRLSRALRARSLSGRNPAQIFFSDAVCFLRQESEIAGRREGGKFFFRELG